MPELRQRIAGLVYLPGTFRPGCLAVDAKCERMYNESLTLAAEFPGQKVMGGFRGIASVVVTPLTANSGFSCRPPRRVLVVMRRQRRLSRNAARNFAVETLKSIAETQDYLRNLISGRRKDRR